MPCTQGHDLVGNTGQCADGHPAAVVQDQLITITNAQLTQMIAAAVAAGGAAGGRGGARRGSKKDSFEYHFFETYLPKKY